MKSKKRTFLVIFILVIVALVVSWFSLEFGIRRYINNKIDKTEKVSGSVGKVDINPFVGLYSVGDIKLSFAGDATEIPALNIRATGFNLDWGALLSGVISGNINIRKPEIRIINKSKPEEKEPPESPPVARSFRDFFPIQVDLITITDGEFRMRDETQPAPLEIDITEINGEIRNLTNTLKLSDNLFASANFTAIVLESGKLSLKLKLAPVAENLNFNLICNITGIELVKMNDFLKEAAGITPESGTLTIDMILNAEQGSVRGFVETIYQNIKFLDPDNDIDIMERLKDGVAGLVGEVIENKEDRIVTRIPVNIRVRGTKPDVLLTVLQLLQQALVNAIIPIMGNVPGGK